MNNRYITKKCYKCNGIGKIETRFGMSLTIPDTCWVCKGTGNIPNEEGQEILELIKLFGRKF